MESITEPTYKKSCRWDDNVKSDIQEVGCGVWIGSSWLRTRTGGGHV